MRYNPEKGVWENTATIYERIDSLEKAVRTYAKMEQDFKEKIENLQMAVIQINEELDRHNRIMGWNIGEGRICPTKEDVNHAPNIQTEE